MASQRKRKSFITKDWFVSQRLSDFTADRLVVVGKGESDLLNMATPDAAENRRVVFKVINYKH